MLENTGRPTRRETLADIGLMHVFLALGVFEYFVFGERSVETSVMDKMREPVPLLLALTVLTIVPLAIRRRYPIWAVVAGHAGFIATTGFGFQVMSSAQFSLLVPFYGLALYVRPRLGDVVRLLVTAAMVVWVTVGALVSGVPFGLIPLMLMLYVATWVVGNTARARHQNALLLRERAERAEREHERQAARAVRSERARIARELHDVVAHSITVMTVQATGAKRVMASSPDRAKFALEAIEATGRQALGEMRRMVGVMRSDEDDIGLAPQPGLTGLPDLIDFVEASGVGVEWSMDGDAAPLPPGVELTAYRVVQEALTNTIKHGGPNTLADVIVRFEPGRLWVKVTDNGRGAASNGHSAYDEGHGILGMRERVALYGGTLAAGPRPGGGFGVTALIPVEDSR